jgi:hypothetical protein
MTTNPTTAGDADVAGPWRIESIPGMASACSGSGRRGAILDEWTAVTLAGG